MPRALWSASRNGDSVDGVINRLDSKPGEDWSGASNYLKTTNVIPKEPFGPAQDKLRD